ncbi:MAG: DotU family type IV/VI secretion system protein [Polyangiaceae bacterium]|nr:DotU family type IV/VI secretion system protein [Polyangiaceae bacterium]
MKKSQAELWAAIDAAFTEVVSVCREARAAEALLERKHREDAVAQGRQAEAETHSAIPNERVHPRLASIDDLVEDLAFQKKHPNGADLVAMKAKIRDRLHLLKNALASTYSEEDTHAILFPIVVYFDELVRFVSRDVAIQWETLQGEIYNTESGGEEFYKYLEQIKSPQLAVEVYYYCLQDGFEGMYADDPARIDDYKKQLEARMQIVPIAAEPPRAEPPAPELVKFPVLYYVAAAGAIVGLYFVLRLIGASY